MSVISMPSDGNSREVALLLSGLTKQALAGNLAGVVVSFQSIVEGEGTAFAGSYARDRSAAMKACLRQSVALGLYDAQSPATVPARRRPARKKV